MLAFLALISFAIVGTSDVPAQPSEYVLEELPGSYSSPLLVTHAPGDARIFVVEQGGRVEIVKDGSALTTPFVNISGLLTSPRGAEQGLLGMAFHPGFSSNGRFFLAYTDGGGDLVVGEFNATPGSDVASSTQVAKIIEVNQPFTNHNGGHILFGPNGYLWVGVGDGGGGGDPADNGQDNTTLLGSILRIDVDSDDFPGDSSKNYGIPPGNPFDSGAGADEIWVYGLRNPWRFWIDDSTDRLYIADVGQGQREEITVVSLNGGGENLGWNILEGSRCYPNGGSCSTAGTVLPQVEYTHSVGRSITGGIVYRGEDLTELNGTYFYGDFSLGWVRSMLYDGSVDNHWDWEPPLSETSLISSFGIDDDGEMYIVSLGGDIWRLEGRSGYQVIGDFDDDGDSDISMWRGGDWFTQTASDAGGGDFDTWADFVTLSGWGDRVSGDFDGDGDTDIGNYHNGTGNWVVSESTGSSFSSTVWTTFSTKTGWSKRLVGDFDGDGRDDIANYHPGTGNWVVSESTGNNFNSSVWATFNTKTGWTRQIVGDFNGDGRDDIANYHPGTGNWVVSESTGNNFNSSVWATFNTKTGWATQIPGDFDGDGKTDIGNYHPGSGNWVVAESDGNNFDTSVWATYTTKTGWLNQIPGDFTGDGKTDIANYHPGSGNWVVSKSNATSFTSTVWTTYTTKTGWTRQITGDFNGDNQTDIANYHQLSGNWVVSFSSGSGFSDSLWSRY